MKRELQATAYHEAGHAVVAFFNRVRFKHATIIKGDDSLGHVLLAKSPKWFQPEYENTARVQFFAEQRIVIDYAGQLAEGKFRGRRPRWGMGQDNEHAVDMAFYFCGSQKTVEAYLHYCWCRSSDAVNARWAQIQAVAAALLERKTLTLDEVREIVLTAPWKSA
jgi:ATP-dependent Zn protease